jgi:CsoR family transcriptional regulator, copper-sensing transcriptional repressor
MGIVYVVKRPMTSALRTDATKRLARIAGQVSGLQKMVAGERACADVLQQIVALRGALDQLGVIYLTEHLQSCVLHQGTSGEDHFCTDLPEAARSEEIRSTLTRFLK